MVEEEALLIGPNIRDQQVGLDRVIVEEMLRCLHQADALVVEERHRAQQKVALGDEISIEYSDEFGRIGGGEENAQRMIDVSRLRMAVVGAGQITGPLGPTQLFEPWPPTVIEHPYSKIPIVNP